MAKYSVALLVLGCFLVGSHATTTKPQQQETAASKDLCEVSTWVLRFSYLTAMELLTRYKTKVTKVKFWLGSGDVIKKSGRKLKIPPKHLSSFAVNLRAFKNTKVCFWYCDPHKY